MSKRFPVDKPIIRDRWFVYRMHNRIWVAQAPYMIYRTYNTSWREAMNWAELNLSANEYDSLAAIIR